MNAKEFVLKLKLEVERQNKAILSSLIVSVILLIVAGSGLVGPRVDSFAATQSVISYDNLQVFVTPQNSSDNIFSMTVFNSTGGVVATSESSYPAFSFELPNGTYLLTVTASASRNYGVPVPLANGAGSSIPAVIVGGPYGYQQEYGFDQIVFNSSRSVSISISELSSIATSEVTILAKFANGSAASGASVYASVLGSDGWYYPGSSLAMSNQTGSDGTATLEVPEVPLEVTLWDWLPVNLPHSQITTQVTVAGEPVNVTAYWQPSYIGLAGSALLTPPFQQTSITLQPQQQNFWAYPQGVESTPSTAVVPGVQGAGSSGTSANSPIAVPASVYAQEEGGSASQGSSSQPSEISIPASVVTVTTTQSASAATSLASSNGLLIEAGVLAAVVVSLAAVAVALRRK